MAYCTKANLIERFGDQEVADLLDRNTDGTEDVSAFDNASADTDALIDGYVSGRYQTPLNPVPALIQAAACDICRFKLWDDRAPTEIRKRYDDAVALLRDVAMGKINLPSTVAAASTSSGGIEYEANERVFTVDSLSGF